jgi:hypothetical protein
MNLKDKNSSTLIITNMHIPSQLKHLKDKGPPETNEKHTNNPFYEFRSPKHIYIA